MVSEIAHPSRLPIGTGSHDIPVVFEVLLRALVAYESICPLLRRLSREYSSVDNNNFDNFSNDRAVDYATAQPVNI
ncbi:unnamed protein product [Haemonchus placei]|uniref:Uncharacterized protein n=1 Tax=Haemonchus placei TaxID=6290 RepID=A0A0N4X958_HAEPC|nr:unnamed protein product [Haemonchus placei]